MKLIYIFSLETIKEAREILEKIIETKPKHFSALRFLILLNAREKSFDEARQLAERLVTLNKTNLQSYYALLDIKIALKRMKKSKFN